MHCDKSQTYALHLEFCFFESLSFKMWKYFSFLVLLFICALDLTQGRIGVVADAVADVAARATDDVAGVAGDVGAQADASAQADLTAQADLSAQADLTATADASAQAEVSGTLDGSRFNNIDWSDDEWSDDDSDNGGILSGSVLGDVSADAKARLSADARISADAGLSADADISGTLLDDDSGDDDWSDEDSDNRRKSSSSKSTSSKKSSSSSKKKSSKASISAGISASGKKSGKKSSKKGKDKVSAKAKASDSSDDDSNDDDSNDDDSDDDDDSGWSGSDNSDSKSCCSDDQGLLYYAEGSVQYITLSKLEEIVEKMLAAVTGFYQCLDSPGVFAQCIYGYWVPDLAELAGVIIYAIKVPEIQGAILDAAKKILSKRG